MKFMQAAKHGGSQSRVDRIVIHATVSPCVPGGAKAVGGYFQSAGAGGSAHYTVDPGEAIQSVRESVVAYHAPPNTASIGVELCDPMKGPASRWQDVNHEAMLQRAARLVQQIAARWDVPLRRLSVAEVRAGKRGICGHVDVSKAFHMTDHTDPGDAFPWSHFMDLVTGGTPEESWTEKLMKDLPELGVGDEGFDVKTVRWLLGARGAGTGSLDLLNTEFDSALADLVKDFQDRNGLKKDGVVGEATWSKLLRV